MKDHHPSRQAFFTVCSVQNFWVSPARFDSGIELGRRYCSANFAYNPNGYDASCQQNAEPTEPAPAAGACGSRARAGFVRDTPCVG